MTSTCAKTRCTRPATHVFRLLGPNGWARRFCTHHTRQDQKTFRGRDIWVQPLNPRPVVKGVSDAS